VLITFNMPRQHCLVLVITQFYSSNLSTNRVAQVPRMKFSNSGVGLAR
jgi:hypothetical protein